MGRKKKSHDEKKTAISLKLPPYLIKLMDEQPISRAKQIEIALLKMNNWQTPT
jgi:hypothetical protein